VGYEVKKMKKIGGILKNGCPLNVFIYLFISNFFYVAPKLAIISHKRI
jgi:uncharacterized membrane protein